ncbi:MAG: hypothetical protein JO034_30110 [Singulisphaera sp.]|nr:hypothetical protein [Singulisphaera sp.]
MSADPRLDAEASRRTTPVCPRCGAPVFGEFCVFCDPHPGSIHDRVAPPARRPARSGRRARPTDDARLDFFPAAPPEESPR